MTLSWTLLPAEKLVTAVIEDDVDFSDVDRYLEDVYVKGGLAFRKLIDARRGRSHMTESELLTYAGRIKAYSQMSKLGALAVVAGEDKSRDHASMFRALAVNGARPISIFATVEQAMAWLDKMQPVTAEQTG